MIFNDSPVGTAHRQGEATDEAREELMKNLAHFLGLAPTAAEMEIIDTLISTFTWSYEGYSFIFQTAKQAHRLIHKEEARWIMKKK